MSTGDFQSLADLGNGFRIVLEMKHLPINRRTLFTLVFSAALPMVPPVSLDPWAMEAA